VSADASLTNVRTDARTDTTLDIFLCKEELKAKFKTNYCNKSFKSLQNFTETFLTKHKSEEKKDW